MSERREKFANALKDKHVPVLVLDSKWHKLFKRTGSTKRIAELEEELSALLKRQGKLNNENKELKKVKANLMNEIVSNIDGVDGGENSNKGKKLNENKRLINDVNERIDNNEDELMELPRSIDEANKALMVETMDLCYDLLKANTDEIEQIADWIHDIRIKLKKNLIIKQEKEINNSELYSFMHDVFGADVMELFDMKYEPTLPSVKKSEKLDHITDV